MLDIQLTVLSSSVSVEPVLHTSSHFSSSLSSSGGSPATSNQRRTENDTKFICSVARVAWHIRTNQIQPTVHAHDRMF